MKRMTWFLAGALLLIAGMASAQSLGDAARAARKNKPQQTSTSKHFDNDNLPTNDHLSVVGPPPTESDPNPAPAGQPAEANAQTAASTASPAAPADANGGAAPTTAQDPRVQAGDREKANDEWQKKIDGAKKNIETLNHDLDITEREYRLRAVAMYSDAGNRLRNSAQWDKEDADFKQQIEAKQKALDQAKQQLDQMQEDARKAGVPSRMRE